MNKKNLYFWIILFDSVVVAVAIFLGIHDDDPLKHLEERGFLTLISVFQLLAISVVSWLVFLKSKNQKKTERKFWQCLQPERHCRQGKFYNRLSSTGGI